MDDEQKILLVGMMGSGKTSVGERLAQRLGVPYLDSDALVLERTGKQVGATLTQDGVAALRRAEADALDDALDRVGPAVVSVAAGTVLDPGTRGAIDAGGWVVWLRAKATTLAARIADQPERPRHAPDLAAWFGEETERRAPLFEEVADTIVDVEGWTVDELVDRIARGIPGTLGRRSARPAGHLPGVFAAVVLDLDGLLVDTEVVWLEAKKLLFDRHGVAFTVDAHREVLGTSEDFTARTFARRLGLPDTAIPGLRDEYLDTVRERFDAGVKTRPGAHELLGALRGRVPLGLASNTRRELVDLILDRARLAGSFDAIATADEAHAKPAPDIYLLACRRLAVAPKLAVAVEDSPTGVRAAKAAGMTCYGVPSEHTLTLDGADLVVGSLLELVDPADRAAFDLDRKASPGR